MVSIKKNIKVFRHALIAMTLVISTIALMTACKVSLKFNGASIDYTKTKTIRIADFPIRSSYVWGPMGPMFNNQLKDVFANHTHLQQVKRGGDLVIEGEITQYSQRNKSVSSEGYSAQTELSMTVNVRFTNNANHSQDFENSLPPPRATRLRKVSPAFSRNSCSRCARISPTKSSTPPSPTGNHHGHSAIHTTS